MTLVSEKPGFFHAKPDDIGQDLVVVTLIAVVAAHHIAPEHFFPQSPVISIGHKGKIAGGLKRKEPFPFHALSLCGIGSLGPDTLWKP